MTDRDKFNKWMKEVNTELMKLCGLDSNCLADCAYYDWFLDEVEPAEAARDVLAANDFPMDVFDFL